MKGNEILEYSKIFKAIRFKIFFSHKSENPLELFFAAIPLEDIEIFDEPLESNNAFIYGKVDNGLNVYIGFREFQFKMTEDLHKRLGNLYSILKSEYVKMYNKSSD